MYDLNVNNICIFIYVARELPISKESRDNSYGKQKQKQNKPQCH